MKKYQKPVSYSLLRNSNLSLNDILNNKEELFNIIAYDIESKVKMRFSGNLSCSDIECLTQDSLCLSIKDFNRYIDDKALQEKESLNFWSYICTCEKANISKAYNNLKAIFGESAYKRKIVYKIKDCFERNMSVDDIAKLLKLKKATVIKYMNLCNPILSYNVEENGQSFVDFIAAKDDEEDNLKALETAFLNITKYMSDENKYIIKVYLTHINERDWKKKTISECKERWDVTETKVIKTINIFKREVKKYLN